MPAVLEILDNLERRLHLTIPIEIIHSATLQRLKNMAPKIKMQGFRPGKVPLKIVEQQYGQQIREEVHLEEMNHAYQQALTEHNLSPIGQPNFVITEKNPTEEFKYSVTFEVFPEVKMSDISTVTIEKPTLELSDADIDDALEKVRKHLAVREAVERAAQNGDEVDIDFTGTIDGEKFDGGSAKNYTFILGDEQMLPDFEAGVLGLSAGQTRVADVHFPADYGQTAVAGKKAVFEMTLNKVSTLQLAEMNADFVKSFGIEEGDMSSIRQAIKDKLGHEVEEKLQARLKQTILQTLLDISQLELPKMLVKSEQERLTQNTLDRLQENSPNKQAVTLEPQTIELLEKMAKRRVKLGIIIAHLNDTHHLDPQPEHIMAQLTRVATTYNDPYNVVSWYLADKERLKPLEAIALESNILDFVLEQATVVQKPVTVKELMARRVDD